MELSELDEQLSQLAGGDTDVEGLVAGLLEAQGLGAFVSLEDADTALAQLAEGVVEGQAQAVSVSVPVSTPAVARRSSIPVHDPARSEQELDAILGIDPSAISSPPPEEVVPDEPAPAAEAEPEGGLRDTWSDTAPADSEAAGQVQARSESPPEPESAAPAAEPAAESIAPAAEPAAAVDLSATLVDEVAPAHTVEAEVGAAEPDMGREADHGIGAESPAGASDVPVTRARAARERRDTLEDQPALSRPSPAASVDDAEIDAILNTGLAGDGDGLDLPGLEAEAEAPPSRPAAAPPPPQVSVPPPLPASGPPRVSAPPPVPGAAAPTSPPVQAAAAEDDDSFELLIDDEDVLELDDEELELLDD